MVTKEALVDMRERLSPDGLFLANVLSPAGGPGKGFLERFRATLSEVFGDVRVYVTDDGADPFITQNLVVVATQDLRVLPELGWPQTDVGPAGRVFTDSWAPVEYLQAKVFLNGLRWN
jgi:hypothetical protein